MPKGYLRPMRDSSTHDRRIAAIRRDGFSRGVSSVLTGGKASKRIKPKKGDPKSDMNALARDGKKSFRGFGDA